MSFQYAFLKRAVRLAGLKRMWGGSVDELVAKKKKQNAKSRIPELRDTDIEATKTEVMGFPVLRMTHHQRVEKANLFIIGGGMVSAPRPGSLKKALRFAKETGLDLFVPFYPLCTDYPLTKAYEMIHETYRAMQKYGVDYRMIVGKGMFHCYPVFPIVPEAKEGWRQMVELMKA